MKSYTKIQFIILIFIFLSISSCEKPEYEVIYDVTCGNCLITYHDRDNNPKSVVGNYGNWSFTFRAKPEGFVYLGVVSFPDNTGFVEIARARIIVGNKEFRSGKSTKSNPEIILSGFLKE